MLALDVNHLTNKLQKQTLEESSDSASNIKLINPEAGYKLSEAAQVKLKGNNVWRVSLRQDSEDKSVNNSEFTAPAVVKSSAVTKVLCSHKKLIDTCVLCDSPLSPAVPNERPKKRNCQSISAIAPENDVNVPPAKSSWQPQGSRLWKPISNIGLGYGSTSPYSSVAMGTGRNCHRHGIDEKWDIRQTQWSPTDSQNYVFSSLAPSVQRHMETGHITPDDLLTPPESPVPRPNSVYSDGAISPFYFHMDFTFNRGTSNYIQEFRNRSLSVEDKISCSTSVCGSTSTPTFNSSVPSSPHHRYKVPRCRSQPSFYDRKSGRRRRRDLRPTLNFNKMTETAYSYCRRPETRPDHRNNNERMDSQWQSSRFRTELDSAMSLMPIASSPRDTDLNAYSIAQSQHGTSPIHELESTSRDNLSVVNRDEDSVPVKLLGDDDQDEVDMEVFQLTEELDLEQIENH